MVTNGLAPPMGWWCPQCGRATPTTYRCQNWDCYADLAGEPLEAVDD